MFEPSLVAWACNRSWLHDHAEGGLFRLNEDCNGELARSYLPAEQTIEIHAYGRHGLLYQRAFGAQWGMLRVAPKILVDGQRVSWYVGEHRKRRGFGSSPMPLPTPDAVKMWMVNP